MSARYLTCLLICTALCGCSGGDSATYATLKPPAADPKTESTEKAPVEPKDPPPVEKTSQAEDPTREDSIQAEYQPPYPDRENLFLAPKRSASHNNTPGTVQQSVELLGFANVEGPRVILSIDGNVVPMAEGGTASGIEVISIQPPTVVLQRDRERWQATLEN